MTLADLKLDQEVEINGFPYIYKGTELRYIDKTGNKECYIFYSEKLKSEKSILCSKVNKVKVKNVEGKIII